MKYNVFWCPNDELLLFWDRWPSIEVEGKTMSEVKEKFLALANQNWQKGQTMTTTNETQNGKAKYQKWLVSMEGQPILSPKSHASIIIRRAK